MSPTVAWTPPAQRKPLPCRSRSRLARADSTVPLSLSSTSPPQGVVACCATKTPGFGEVRTAFLEDICVFSGAKFFTSELAMNTRDATIADCGKVSKAVITKNKVSSG